MKIIGWCAICGLVLLMNGCASTPESSPPKEVMGTVETSVSPGVLPSGFLVVNVKDILGAPRDARVILRNSAGDEVQRVAARGGSGRGIVEIGSYTAHVEVFDGPLPLVVSIQPVSIAEAQESVITYQLLLGVAGGRSLRAFDQDGDLVIDGVEIEQGTDPYDAISRPNTKSYRWPVQVLSEKEGWLRGELHAHSEYGVGTESVSKVIGRAERLGLDFLSILDRNTLGPALDKDFRSSRTVLIPGMEWGDDTSGVALVYAPGSLPPLPKSEEEMAAYTTMLQAQGGLVYAGHPSFPTSPWNWDAKTLNGVQAWCMEWRGMPPIGVQMLQERHQIRTGEKYATSNGRAAAMAGLSANGQATAFWDFEMSSGISLGLIGGSQTGSPKVKMAEPVTYVYAKQKSLPGILEGMRLGRTFVSKGLDGPTIEWVGDIFDDGSIDVSIGGTVPLDHPTRYFVRVRGAKEKKLELMLNGVVTRSVPILLDDWVFSFVQNPGYLAVYRVRVVDTPTGNGFGLREMFAMTSPIYANGIVQTDDIQGEQGWVRIENDYLAPAQIDNFIEYLEDNFRPNN